MSITTFAEKSTLMRLRLFSSCNPCYNLQRTRCLTHNKRRLGETSFNVFHRSHSTHSSHLLLPHQHTWKTTQLRPRYSITNYILNRSISSYDDNNNNNNNNNNSNNQDESTFDQYYDNSASTLFTTTQLSNDGDFYDHDVQTNENPFNKRNINIETSNIIEDTTSRFITDWKPSNTALWMLNYHYMNTYGISNATSNLDSKVIMIEAPSPSSSATVNPFWIASFICPVSGIIYSSGRFRNSSMLAVQSTTDNDGETVATSTTTTTTLKTINDEKFFEYNGQILYYRKKMAIHAVAGIVMDHIRFEKFGISEPCFCVEDPSLLITHSEKNNSGNRSTDMEADIESTMKLGNESEFSDRADVNQNDIQANFLTTEVVHPEEEHHTHSKKIISKPIPEYTIIASPTYTNVTPAQRLFEVSIPKGRDIIDNNNKDFATKSSQLSSSSYEWPSPKFVTSNRQRIVNAIENAKKWIDMNSEYDHQTQQQTHLNNNLYNNEAKQVQFDNNHKINLFPVNVPTKRLVANVILKGLAQANQSQPTHVDSGVEQYASQILDILWKNDDSEPDTTSYTSYLKCLGGESPVNRAHDVVKAMEDGSPWNGHVLPKPDQNTYNTLIQLTAHEGGISKRLLNIGVGGKNFIPDRQSFISMLSSLSYRRHKSRFDSDFAKSCIDTMNNHYEDSGDISLVPDIQIYNAPLAWAGGDICWLQSRPYARFIPWDRYSKFFADGYRRLPSSNIKLDDEDHLNTQNAVRMEVWLRDIEKNSESTGIKPNIETYEAIIQAWIRSLTREGLDRADLIARQLLDNDNDASMIYHHPRLQTFHPIIAAWLHSKDPESIEKVDYWIDRLLQISEEKNKPGLRPDMRMISAQLSLKIKKQLDTLIDIRKYLNQVIHNEIPNGSSDSQKESKDMVNSRVREIIDVAESASKILARECDRFEKHCIEGRENEVFLDIHLFTQTIDAWHNAAVCYLLQQDYTQASAVIAEMTDIALKFERIVECVIETEMKGGIDFSSDVHLSNQLKHIVISGRKVCMAYVGSLSKLHELADGNVAKPPMLIIEVLCRRVIEMYEISKSYDLFNDSKIRYDDLFEYYSGELDNASNSYEKAHFTCVTKYISIVPVTESNLGSVTRVLFLLQDFATKWNKPSLNRAVDHMVSRLLQASKSHAFTLNNAPNTMNAITKIKRMNYAASDIVRDQKPPIHNNKLSQQPVYVATQRRRSITNKKPPRRVSPTNMKRITTPSL